jgi:nitrate/TMAO reductase-like tetraheme cytochrome c subunit
MPGFLRRAQSAFQRLVLRNTLTIFGASLTTVSVAAIVFILFLGQFDFVNAAYLGIVTFLILPLLMVGGLLSVAAGHYWAWLRPGSHPEPKELESLLVIDLRDAGTRVTVFLVAVLTLVNIFMVSAVGYKGVRYSESVEFCGTTCHSVMEPEYTAFLDSPHSKIACAECHIGTGAQYFVKAKASGLRQVYGVLTGTYERPIKTPVHDLRPARDICEDCHTPEKTLGLQLKRIPKFSEDEKNTELTTLLLLNIGGGAPSGKGIHEWHLAANRSVYYLPQKEDRSEISLVRVRHADGMVEDFAPADFQGDPATIPDSALRRMDCMDCHNRPAHQFQAPDRALDEALHAGEIDRNLPFIRKVGLEALLGAEKEEQPESFIRQHVTSFYASEYANLGTELQDALDAAILRLTEIFRRNVFPHMKVGWNTYPVHNSHIASPGCFRCHDDAHSTAAGKAIRQDCTICHQVLAWEEENPQVAQDLGLQ